MSVTALAKIPDVRLVLQPGGDPDFDICAYYAVANLFALRGLEPPSVAGMVRFMKELEEHKEWEGLTDAKIAMLLDVTGFPCMTTLVNLPVCMDMTDYIKNALQSGFLLSLNLCFVEELSLEAAMVLTGDKDFAGLKVWATHSVIPYHFDEESGMVDFIFGWKELPTKRLKVKEIMFPDYMLMGFGWHHTGFARSILQIWPFPGEA